MTIKEKVAFASQNNKLYCFKEGIFYKVYNQNAMWFSTHIKAYKINTKFIKTVNQHVFSLGFPQSVLTTTPLVYQNKALTILQENESYIAYKINNIATNLQAYINWCKMVENNQIPKQNNSINNTVLQELKNFDIVNKTPMQAFEFVVKLKELATKTPQFVIP